MTGPGPVEEAKKNGGRGEELNFACTEFSHFAFASEKIIQSQQTQKTISGAELSSCVRDKWMVSWKLPINTEVVSPGK